LEELNLKLELLQSARYGIKIYVVTDAVTSFVLRIIIYTGSDTYYFNNNVGDKKTVQVVKQLLEPYYGTNRCVYIDRFYTSIDLLKELQKNQIYVTGKFI
jgi:Transposase IS4